MLSIDPNTNTERENYKFLIGSIIPRPIAFVTTLSEDGVLNGAPFSYFNIVSSNPPMISLSIQRSGGKQKDTARNIIKQKEFVVHIVDEENVEKVNKTAASLPPHESEIVLAQLTKVESEKISVQGVKQAKIRMECVLEYSLELGEKELPGCDLIIGKVIQFHIEDDIYENGRIDPKGLAAVSRLAGANYAKIGEIFEIERPK
ncbi:flavin reductase family protein [Lederbergia wuyishanensis]|uniref:Flavin reductase (DIM6/NTAB) family NADH-FMN oxidoreductase RutF n=1 Tax=Lederbergia wuyishanensis TaxID=1347903 RepID=A0ABU0D6A1_9BACI|nr:flavin reductase family protein [Lederbergia wuyishanensis]MCJ8008676.1 flavin reductase family protein [Lederbergia wuyishanensis]MDQ0343905.1 flavin reductase (DIM6/NTAB) family NADH-FMN oxidoreductase RutF [Lederbergia wuyishanensis]